MDLQSVEILSASMEPTIRSGAVVSFERRAPAVGEVAVFMVGEAVMVHRVIARWDTCRGVYFLHRGDAGGKPGIFKDHEALGVVKDIALQTPGGLEALSLWMLGLLVKVYAEYRRLKDDRGQAHHKRAER